MGVVKTVDVGSRVPSTRSGVTDLGTRDRIAGLIGQDGPITVADLADTLGLTPAAVRRHVDAMLDEGHLEARDLYHKTRGRGRPAKAYVLTEAAHAQLPAGYDTLAVQALGFLAEKVGKDAIRAFARQRATDLETHLKVSVDAAGNDPRARVQALAEALRHEGYAATARPVAEGTPAEAVQLCQGHCPVQTVAASFPELCEAETEAFARLVGTDVRRLATLAHGDHVCTTHIPVGPPSARRRPSPETPSPGTPAQHPEESAPDMRGESS